eukprot:1600008-Amphidinium_carterae.2
MAQLCKDNQQKTILRALCNGSTVIKISPRQPAPSAGRNNRARRSKFPRMDTSAAGESMKTTTS